MSTGGTGKGVEIGTPVGVEPGVDVVRVDVVVAYGVYFGVGTALSFELSVPPRRFTFEFAL